jgi:Phospholipase_D-nuclease N-terminal/Short C-terminal domain
MALLATSSGYPLLNLFWTMLIFFGFVLWIWLLVVVFSDIFRRDDIGGWGKAGWIVLMIILPYLGVLAYLIVECRAMAERRRQEAADTRARFESDVRTIAADGHRGPADEIATAKRLLDHGDITRDEYETLKRKALGLPAAEQAR